MRRPFSSTRGGVRVRLEQPEREVLVQLLGQLDELLDDGTEESSDPLARIVGMGGLDPRSFGPDGFGTDGFGPDGSPSGGSGMGAPDHTGPPQDPALARLLPEGNRDDPEASAEFRRLTEYGLRSRKREAARAAAAALTRDEPVVLAPPEALALMKAITDVRLVLGERLDLRTDQDAETMHERLWSQDGPPAWLAIASVYELLTGWQEHLVAAVERSR